MSRVDILGCTFDVVTEDSTVKQCFEWIEAAKNEPKPTTHHIITVNVAILMMAKDDPKLTDAIEKADMVVVDGKPLVWTSKWLETPVPERVSGVDLMRLLLEQGDKRGLRIFLLGTTQERLDVLERVIRARYPGVTIAGSRNGYFKAPDYPDIARMIRESKADLLLVGMPAPFKEIWVEQHRDLLETPCVIGVGGAFDVMAGFVARAPRLVQEIGMEWFWRMAMEPRKLFKRYLVTNSQFIALLGKTMILRRVSR